MKTQHDNGGPVFPIPDDDGDFGTNRGMSLRDYLASQENLSDFDMRETWGIYDTMLQAFNGPAPDLKDTKSYFLWEFEARAKIKYARADAILKARRKTNEQKTHQKNTSDARRAFQAKASE